jgi:hypothetical protein
MSFQDTGIDTTLFNTKPMSNSVTDTWRCFRDSCCFYHHGVYASRYSATCLFRHRNGPNFLSLQSGTVSYSKDPRENKRFLLQTGFRYSRFPFMTGFRVGSQGGLEQCSARPRPKGGIRKQHGVP